VKVQPLAEVPDLAPEIALALHRQWWEAEGWSLVATEAFLHAACGPQLPIAYVAVDDGKWAGTATLDRDDLQGFAHLVPWVASVLVAPAFRRHGVATALARRIEAEAQALGYGEVWLHTPDQAVFWGNRGYRLVSEERWLGKPTSLMRKEFAPARHPLVALRTNAK